MTATLFDRDPLPPRAVRKDKGTRKPHPLTCRHCTELVETYRGQRAAEEHAVFNEGGWRDESWPSRIITFHKWLKVYVYESDPDFA